jgi:hypothetical protein
MYGPKRRAPTYYAGETYARRILNYPDVERFPNGGIAGIRDKAARRLIRSALKRKFSKVEKGLGLPRAMKAQAREVARADGKSTRWARRLYEQELAIHQAVYVPSQKETRAIRTQKRKLKREGKLDAIGALVDRMAKP